MNQPQQHPLVQLMFKQRTWQDTRAVYAVQTAKAGTAFMRITKSNYQNDQRTVVVVDSQKLIAAWKRNTYYMEPMAFADESCWRNDPNFHHAEEGFSHGIENPVPLALVGASNDKTGTSVGFTNGITRTIWLLANGAQAFPIECSKECADVLHTAAGLSEFPITTVEELFRDL